MPQTVCRYWLQGYCKYGDSCRFDHSRSNLTMSNENRFAALQHSLDKSSQDGGGPGSKNQAAIIFDKETIIADLTVEKPQWILSAYGPARKSSAQLFGGYPREQSFEEIRLLHYMASPDPQRVQQAISEANKLVQDAEQQIQHTIQNIDDAIKYLNETGKEEGNRFGNSFAHNSANPFAPRSSIQTTPSTPQSNNDRQQQTTNAIATFGKPTLPVFGTPTAPAGAFGQPSFQSQATNPFASKPVFGAPSQPSSIFGSAAMSNSTGNNFVNQNQVQFGQNKPNTESNPFQKYASNDTRSPLVQSTSNTASQQHPFSAASNQLNPFSTQSSTPNNKPSPFSAQSSSAQHQSNPFSTKSSISASQQNPFSIVSPSSPFGMPPSTTGNDTQPASRLFGQNDHRNLSQQPNSFSPVANSQPSIFGQPSASFNPFGPSTTAQPLTPNHSKEIPRSLTDQSKKPLHPTNADQIKSFKGKSVIIRDSNPGFLNKDGVWERIWFPNGKPPFSADAKAPCDLVYDDAIIKAYDYARVKKVFEEGIIPPFPPKEEWCGFDF